MTVASELLALTRTAASAIALPPVARLHVPAYEPDPAYEGEFGVVVLADGSTGFFFALLGETLRRLHRDFDRDAAARRPPLALAEGIESGDEVTRAVALGAISAVSQHVFARAGLRLDAAASSLGGFEFEPGDHVGMVGLFPSLARRLRERGVRLTVVELKPEKVQREPRFEVTLDPARLAGCNKVLCTASTLLNDTLETILHHCSRAERVALVGPTASCFPDPLFARGVHVMAGSTVVDHRALLERLDGGERWGDAVTRYTLPVEGYPGVDALLARLA